MSTAIITVDREIKAREGTAVSCLARAGEFVRAHGVAIAAISFGVLVPCFWHPRIEAGDLGSHAYNAWLALLIKSGNAPGLLLTQQWTNVLFDSVLTWLSAVVGFSAAQRIAVGASVLIFFWGAFATVCAITRRVPWFITPAIAVFAYGAVFHQGLFNYYLALGLSFFALAILWRATTWDYAAAGTLLALAWLAQPLPVIWTLSAWLYTLIYRGIALKHRAIPFLAGIAVLLGLREAVVRLFQSHWTVRQILLATGIDQVRLFGKPYRVVFVAFLLIAGVLFVRLVRAQGYRESLLGLPFQMYVLCAVGAFLLPREIWLPSYNADYGDVTERFSLIAAILGCALLAQVKPARWHAGGLIAVAAVFFGLAYRDTGAMNRLESNVEATVRQLPAGERVIGKFYYPAVEGTDISMILDRACIGHCFSFGNYEPSTKQFRVRALPQNSMVAWEQKEPLPSQYFRAVQGRPLYEVSRCRTNSDEVCQRSMNGEQETPVQSPDHRNQ